MFIVNDLRASDVDEAGRLFTTAFPHRAHEVDSWKRPAEQEQARRWGALAGVSPASPTLAGYGALWRVCSDKYRVDVVVHHDWRRRGLGHDLLHTALGEAQQRGARTLQARAGADRPDDLAFLAHRRFVETMRMQWFALHLPLVDEHTLAAWVRACRDDDIAVRAVTKADVDDDDFWRRLCDLHESAVPDWPDPDPGGPSEPTQSSELQQMLLPSGTLPLAFFVASRGDRYVGYSALSARRRSPGEAQFAATAVRPEYRGRRIATTLRARCLTVAKDAGYGRIRSASGSAALIRINARFGFEPTSCEVRLVRQLGK